MRTLQWGALVTLVACGEPAVVRVPTGHLGAMTTAPAVAEPPVVPKLADPQATVSGARDHAIELLMHGSHRDLITSLLDPKTLAEIEAKEGGLDALVAEFEAGSKPAELLELLRRTQGLSPEMRDDGSSARFTFGDPEASRSSVSFKRVENRWYIDDK